MIILRIKKAIIIITKIIIYVNKNDKHDNDNNDHGKHTLMPMISTMTKTI